MAKQFADLSVFIAELAEIGGCRVAQVFWGCNLAMEVF